MKNARNTSSSSAGATSTVPAENPQPGLEDAQSDFVSLNHEAIKRCTKAWKRTFDLASIHPDDESLALVGEEDEFAFQRAGIAFCEALPPLIGYENIRDFIACVTYGLVDGTLHSEECHELLGAAKIAMALLKAQPKSRTPSA
jgi:hypothetical protein